jgi:hypothetical protein
MEILRLREELACAARQASLSSDDGCLGGFHGD